MKIIKIMVTQAFMYTDICLAPTIPLPSAYPGIQQAVGEAHTHEEKR